MRILLTNDDGIHAPGLVALHDALIDRHGTLGGPICDTVWPVAPLTVQSASSHGITFHTPLMVTEHTIHERMKGLAVEGRPADCTKLAICNLWPEHFGAGSRPDLVISGMNAGANCGINVIYSGTVAAAIEAAFLGIPSIAVSLHMGPGKPLFDVAAAHARRVIDRIIAGGMEAHECVSINIPRIEAPGSYKKTINTRELSPADAPLPDSVDPNEMPPVRVCPMNIHAVVDAYERRVSPQGDVYYWAAGHGLDFLAADEDTDVDRLIAHREITVTPLRYDLTRTDHLKRWRERLEG
jgi:5'-nucleotidase